MSLRLMILSDWKRAALLLTLLTFIGCSRGLVKRETVIEGAIAEEWYKVRKRSSTLVRRKLPSAEDHFLMEEPYENGQLHGTVEGRDSSGVVRVRLNYQRGRLNGKATWYHANGRRQSSLEFIEGMIHGKAVEYDSSGKKVIVREFTFGVLDGPAEFRWPGGKRKWVVEKFEKGELDGERREWNDQGVLVSQSHFESGRVNGVCRTWYHKGERESELDFRKGKPHGVEKWWYPSGAIWVEAVNLDSLPQFRLTWREDGHPSKLVWYWEGAVEWTSEWDNLGERVLPSKLLTLQSSRHGNGRLKLRSEMAGGKHNGVEEEWDERGNLIAIRFFQNDELLVQRRWRGGEQEGETVIYRSGAVVHHSQ